MRTRMTLFLVVLVGAILLVAPAGAAAITLSSVQPDHAFAGDSAACVVYGSFHFPVGPLAALPTFTLVKGATTINLTTTGLPAVDRASVTFNIPRSAPLGLYTLNAKQVWGFGPITDSLSLPNAFTVQKHPPVITSLNPSTVVAGGGDLTLTVYGDYFFSGLLATSHVRFNGVNVATTYNSPTVLTATIPAAALATSGAATVIVHNPGSLILDPGQMSDPYTFTITAKAPFLSSLSPASVWAGYVKNDVVLTVGGGNFLAGARIVLNGGDKTATTFVSATQLTVPLVGADIAMPGSLTVSVKNPPFPPGTSSAGALLLPVVAETTDPLVTIGGADSAWHKTPVALTFTATDSQSGVQKVQYQSPPTVATWTDGAAYTVPTSTQGTITVNAQALDWCNRVGTAVATINIDTTKPETAALGNVSVKRGNTARLKYRITEPAGLSPSAKVVIKIKRGNGTTAKSITINSAPTNAQQTYSFRCNLAKGSYKWYVYATDLAGNTQENVARATLTVK